MATKILYVQGTSEVGGSDIALYRLVAHLSPLRFQAIVALPRDGPLRSKLETAGARVIIVPMKQLSPVRSLAYQIGYLLGFWPSVSRLVQLIRHEQVGLVHTNSMFCFYGAVAAWIAQVPHVWHIRELIERPRVLRAVLTRLVLMLSTRVVPMTEAVAAMFGPRGQRSLKIQPIPDGIDLTEFHPSVRGDRIRCDLRLEDHTSLVGFVARLDPWKGVDVFVRAAAAVARSRSHVHFIVCGGELPGYEAHAASARALAEALGLFDRIHFTGWTYRLDDIPEVMAALDIFVHTSIKPEPFGLVLVEAMATCKPVVAADGGGVPEVVARGETGLLVGPGDWQAVANSILELLDDPTARQRMGQAGRRRVEQLFDVRIYAENIQALYSEILRPVHSKSRG